MYSLWAWVVPRFTTCDLERAQTIRKPCATVTGRTSHATAGQAESEYDLPRSQKEIVFGVFPLL